MRILEDFTHKKGTSREEKMICTLFNCSIYCAKKKKKSFSQCATLQWKKDELQGVELRFGPTGVSMCLTCVTRCSQDSHMSWWATGLQPLIQPPLVKLRHTTSELSVCVGV